MPTARESERRKQRYRESLECPMHAYMKHGKEAEELRQGILKIITTYSPNGGDSLDCDCDSYAVRSICDDLQKLLDDDVDARDSLAYLERLPSR